MEGEFRVFWDLFEDFWTRDQGFMGILDICVQLINCTELFVHKCHTSLICVMFCEFSKMYYTGSTTFVYIYI